jgi:hypothetical protein
MSLILFNLFLQNSRQRTLKTPKFQETGTIHLMLLFIWSFLSSMYYDDCGFDK